MAPRSKPLTRAPSSAPLHATPPPSVSAPVDSAKEAEASHRPRILIVDDAAANRIVLQIFLEQQGFAADHAEGGEEAVRLAAAQRYDAILMDIQMPGMDGYTAAQRIRAAEQSGERTLILAVTACIGDDIRRRCMAAGMDGHFSKPLDLQKFCRALAQLVKGGASHPDAYRATSHFSEPLIRTGR